MRSRPDSPAVTRFGFVIDHRSCIGCHTCTVACKEEHGVELGVFRTWVKYIEHGAFPDTRRYFSVLRCNYCDHAPCVEICPVTALYRREDGIVDFDPDHYRNEYLLLPTYRLPTMIHSRSGNAKHLDEEPATLTLSWSSRKTLNRSASRPGTSSRGGDGDQLLRHQGAGDRRDQTGRSRCRAPHRSLAPSRSPCIPIRSAACLLASDGLSHPRRRPGPIRRHLRGPRT